jgi:hypothetical protein
MKLRLASLGVVVLLGFVATRSMRAQGQPSSDTPKIKVTSALVFLECVSLSRPRMANGLGRRKWLERPLTPDLRRRLPDWS